MTDEEFEFELGYLNTDLEQCPSLRTTVVYDFHSITILFSFGVLYIEKILLHGVIFPSLHEEIKLDMMVASRLWDSRGPTTTTGSIYNRRHLISFNIISKDIRCNDLFISVRTVLYRLSSSVPQT